MIESQVPESFEIFMLRNGLPSHALRGSIQASTYTSTTQHTYAHKSAQKHRRPQDCKIEQYSVKIPF